MSDVHCKKCGGVDLFPVLLSARGDECPADHPEARQTAICRDCTQVQDRPVRKKRH